MSSTSNQNFKELDEEYDPEQSVVIVKRGWQEKLTLPRLIFLLIGLMVIAGVFTAFVVVLSGSVKPPNGERPLPKGAKKISFCTDEFIVHAGERLEWNSEPFSREHIGLPVDQPVLIQSVDLHIRDRRGRPIPLEHIYNHHTLLLKTTDYHPIAAFGAERVMVNYGESSGMLVQPEDILFANGEWLDVWGRMATINQTAYACFDVVFIPTDNQTAAAYLADPLECSIFGTSHDGGDFEYSIPANQEEGVTCMTSETEWRYDTIEIFFILGHIHIGAVNQSLMDTSNNQTLVVARPHYDFAGFIDNIRTDIKPAHLVLSRGSTYKTVSCYTNRDQGYSKVMSLWSVCYRNRDHPGEFIDFEDNPVE